jgi:alkanesulfonate monooxygenase SsuD/methylene tetrahydromethanopterin reductase-like flavin-dependent oxidoreductase (luciferase family)/hemerythrin-like domain-containing protein
MSDYGHDLRFGVFILPSNQTSDRVVELSVHADQRGLDLVTFSDHPYQPRFFDTWTLLSFIAARTTGIHVSANVLNLRLREPAVLARAVASLDILSGGRVELGIGTGMAGDAAVTMGARRLTVGEGVEALEEAIDLIRSLWKVQDPSPASFEGRFYHLDGAARGPAPAHDVGLWVGAFKPRMLNLVGRKADGWWPTLAAMTRDDLVRGNAAIDEAALQAGRRPTDIRRLLNVTGRGELNGNLSRTVDELARFALEDGVSTFVLDGGDRRMIETLAAEVAPAVREIVDADRSRGSGGGSSGDKVETPPTTPSTISTAASQGGEVVSEDDRLGVTPTPDDGTRLAATPAWDESTRPHRPPAAPDATYSDRGKAVGQQLVNVHDMLRTELTELREILANVRDGALDANEARSELGEMMLRQNDWTVGAFCSQYCGRVAQHHGVEDQSVFPYLARAEPALAPVIQRLTDEHLVIHDAIQLVDAALVREINDAADRDGIQAAIDFLTDALLSHLSYEEREIVEPLARLGFYPGQV